MNDSGLLDRGIVRVAGADALAFLDNLVTNDLMGIADKEALFAALLTPQGKILFDFFVVRNGDVFLLDVARDKTADLAKRLGLYKLRAKVEIADCSGGGYRVLALWDETRKDPGPPGSVSYADPRSRHLGWRIALRMPGLPEDARALDTASVPQANDAYHARRVTLGVPEGGRDFPYGDTFPHEANMDRLNGVSFAKGCFIGQEVVARMQHKTVVRKRVVPVTVAAPLATGAEITVGEAVIGTVGSVAGNRGLAMVRLDRVVEALDNGQPVQAGGQPVTVDAQALQLFRDETARKAIEKAARI